MEITYYFLIPVFVLGTLMLREYWWVSFIPTSCWVIHKGWCKYRTSHSTFPFPHIPTFLAGSMAAVLFMHIKAWMAATRFECRLIHKVGLRIIEFSASAVF